MYTADDYLNMESTQLSEMERAAYASGDTERAALLEALAKLTQRQSDDAMFYEGEAERAYEEGYRDGVEAGREQPHD